MLCARDAVCFGVVLTLSFSLSSTAYDSNQPFGELLKNAMVLPIVDFGNVGGRMRQLQQLMLLPTYDPWASSFGSTEVIG